MRKSLVLGLAVCLIVGVTACKKGEESAAADPALGKYAAAGPVMDKMIKATEVYVAALDKATNADEVAEAMDVITGKMNKLVPKMKAIGEQYPELKSQNEPPAELKPYVDRLAEVMGKMFGVMGKIAPFASDPKVMAAQERYNKIMAEMK